MGLPEGSPENYNQLVSKYGIMGKGFKNRRYAKKDSKPRYVLAQSKMTLDRLISAKPEYSGISDCTLVKFKYHSNVSFAPEIGTNGHQVWHANSLYDPYSTGTGHQPLYYDELAELYGRFQVHAIKVDIQYVNLNASNNMLAFGVAQQSTGITNYGATDLAERDGSVVRYVASSGSRNASGRLTLYYSLPKVVGMTPSDYNSVYEYGHFTGGNPANLIYFGAACTNLGAATSSLNCQLVFTFYARCFEKRRNVTGS